MKPPTLSLEVLDKVRYYCNVVVASDKYGLPSLLEEAQRGLTTFVTSLEDPTLLLHSLRMLTDDYRDHGSLTDCATAVAKPRLQELTTVPGFSTWLAARTTLLQELVEDANKFRTMKPRRMFSCPLCGNILLASLSNVQPNVAGTWQELLFLCINIPKRLAA